MFKPSPVQGFQYLFEQKGNWFSQVGKTFGTELLYKENLEPLNTQTRQAKSSSEPVSVFLFLAKTLYSFKTSNIFNDVKYIVNDNYLFVFTTFVRSKHNSIRTFVMERFL